MADDKVKESTLKEDGPKEDVQPLRVKEKELYTWTAPSRPFQKRGREFWVTTIAIASLLGIILFLIEGVMPVMLIVALIFLYYVLTNVEPEKVDFEVTNFGIKIGGKRTEWEEIARFWFSTRMDSHLLVLETFTFPFRLECVVGKEDKEKLEPILENYLIHEEAPPTTSDKVINWVANKLPQEK